LAEERLSLPCELLGALDEDVALPLPLLLQLKQDAFPLVGRA
jgi:hypothetical protein